MLRKPLIDLAHDDEDLFDLGKGMGDDYEPPAYPGGLQFSLPKADMDAAGAANPSPGMTMRFSTMGEVTSVFHSTDDARVELELTRFAGDDGKLADLSQPAHICLCASQLGRLGLEADCERGDTLHLMGEARIESCSSTEYGGDRCAMQITHLTVEDESEEAREGG